MSMEKTHEINAAEAQAPSRDASLLDAEKQDLSSNDGDEALKIIGHGQVIEYDATANRRLLWKIDLHLLPVLCLLYGLQFLDKTTISYASVMGIIKDTHLVGTQYNWLGSVFYIGYLFAEYPAVLALQRFPISKFLSSQIIIWGGILMLHAVCHNFGGLVSLRILLGILESSISPGFALIVSQWWQMGEQGFRTGIWFCFNGMGQIFGAVVSYAIAVGIRKNGYDALKGWQVMFLMTGGLTIACGILFFFTVPDSPANAWFLTKEEKVMAIERIRGNNQGVGNKHFKRYQMIEALKDPAAWIFVLYAFTSSVPNGALTNFKNVILQGFGLNAEESLLYGAPNGAVQVVGTLLICWAADKTKNRLIWAAIGLFIPMIGFVLLVILPITNLNGQLAAFYITSTAASGFTLLLSMISSNIAGQTKKSTVSAMFFIAYCVGNLIGPQIINLKDAPRYVTCKIIICVLYGFGLFLLMAMRFLNVYRNKQKDKKMAELGAGYVHRQNQEFMDLTDMENLEFRYVI